MLVSDQRIEQRHVGHAQAHGTDRIAAAGNRNDAFAGIASGARPQRGATIERAGNPHRAAGIGTQCTQRHARAQGGGAAGGRATGDALAIVGIAHPGTTAGIERAVVAGGAEGQLVHVGLAQQDRAGIAQLLQHGSVPRRYEIGESRRTGRTGQAGRMDIVLDHDGDAGQRLQSRTSAACVVGLLRSVQRALGIERDIDIQLPPLFRALQAGTDQFTAAEHAVAEGAHGLADGQVGNDRVVLVIEQIHMGSWLRTQRTPHLSIARGWDRRVCYGKGRGPEALRTSCRRPLPG
ncbi:hypothetical protein D3C85_1021840 [compost metagenome]